MGFGEQEAFQGHLRFERGGVELSERLGATDMSIGRDLLAGKNHRRSTALLAVRLAGPFTLTTEQNRHHARAN